jgi:hypothetical protein
VLKVWWVALLLFFAVFLQDKLNLQIEMEFYILQLVLLNFSSYLRKDGLKQAVNVL